MLNMALQILTKKETSATKITRPEHKIFLITYIITKSHSIDYDATSATFCFRFYRLFSPIAASASHVSKNWVSVCDEPNSS
jgi:hypothetical protein